VSPGSRPLGTLAWVDLTTPDVDSAADFYARLLGWKLESEDTPMGRYVIGVTGTGPAAGMMSPPPGEVGPPPAWAVFFGVGDVAEAFDHACRLGGTGLQPPTEIPGGDRIAVVTDPAGALVGLMEPHGGGSMAWGESGAVAWLEAQSRDLQASGAFYESLLGWTKGPEVDGYRVFERDGEQVAGLMAVPAEVPPEVPSYWLVYFAVDDVDEACTRAGELGGSKLVPSMTVQDMRFAVVEDPLGAVFAVLETSR